VEVKKKESGGGGGGEANHSTPSSVNIRNVWIYTSTFHKCLHGMNWENFTFTFLEYVLISGILDLVFQ